MDKDNQLSFEFKMISGTRVTADFTGGEVTSDGGVLLVREIADRIGIIDRLTDAIVDSRP
jgi:ribosomal protein S3AE